MREKLINLFNIFLVLILICVHFYLTIYRYEIQNEKNWKLDSGFFVGSSLYYSNILFYVGLVLSVILLFLLRGYWKIIAGVYLVLFILHFISSLLIISISYVNLLLWSCLGLNIVISVISQR